MTYTPKHIQNTYLALMFSNTLAASFIWGINTIFLLDAGLSNTQAFLANSFFTIGQVLFEVPTGIVADRWGRKISYMLGSLTLALSTLLYLLAWYTHASFSIWAGTSVLLGLGFTFFSGATEAWLVDALKAVGYKGNLDLVFSKGQIVSGIAMLVGAVGGGFIAQITNLSVPYILRAAILGINFLIALFFMKDLGFKPKQTTHPLLDIKNIFSTSIDIGIRTPSVRWVMLAAPFTSGVGFYTFYAMQPFLLKLYGDQHAYGIAGLAAAIVAGAQIVGGLAVPNLQKIFKRRTSILISAGFMTTVLMVAIGVVTNFWIVLILLIIWGLLFSAAGPVRQAYLNGLIPSDQRATILSFDSMISSLGGVFIQPMLGKVADMWSYGPSYIAGAGFQAISLPFLLFASKSHSQSDLMNK